MKVCAHAEVVTAGEYRSEFNLARVRDSFPALKSDWIFFDNAGGTQVRGRVVERLADYKGLPVLVTMNLTVWPTLTMTVFG